MQPRHSSRLSALALLLVFGLVAVIPSTGRAVEFSSEEKETLAKGEVVRRLSPDNGRNGVFGGSGYAVIDAPPAKIWREIQNWSAYPSIFSNTLETREVSRRDGRSLIMMKLGHPLISVVYHVEMVPDQSQWTMRFRMVKTMQNDLDDIEGYWRLFPMSDGRTLVAYVLKVTVPSMITTLLPESFKQSTARGIIGVPGMMKKWVEK